MYIVTSKWRVIGNTQFFGTASLQSLHGQDVRDPGTVFPFLPSAGDRSGSRGSREVYCRQVMRLISPPVSIIM